MACLVCGEASVSEALNLGEQAIASFYMPARDAPQARVALALGQCAACATIQLIRPVPHTALIPPYDWIWAREPEEHLDTVVEGLMALPGMGADCVVAGLTAKDDSTLERFRALGIARIWRMDPAVDLGVENPAAGIETVQKLTTPETMGAVAASRGQADLLIVRHIIEHTEDLGAFVQGCALLVADGGYIVVEAPDCSRSLELNDYAMPWEEHSLYFTPNTFRDVLAQAGFETLSLDVYPFPFENSLVLVARKTGRSTPAHPEPAEFGRLAAYADAFPRITRQLRARLEARRADGPIAIFGAGHLACAFVNFHGLEDLVDFVADDTPQKQGLYLPGAGLPILPTSELVKRGVRLCLLAVSPQSEDRIIERNADFLASGGEFRSVLSASARSIRLEIA